MGITIKTSGNLIAADRLELLRKKLEYLKTVKQWSDCWELKIPRKKDGRTYIKLEGTKLYLAARVSAALHLGMDLEDIETTVEQKCGNKACWNPAHLEIKHA